MLFRERLDSLMTDIGQGTPFTLLYLDLDEFKAVKDRYPDGVLIASIMEECNKDAWVEIVERTQEELLELAVEVGGIGAYRLLGDKFAYGTLVVNVLGSLLLAVILFVRTTPGPCALWNSRDIEGKGGCPNLAATRG